MFASISHCAQILYNTKDYCLQIVMIKDRVLLNGLTAEMWQKEQTEQISSFLSNPEQKLLVLRVANDTLVRLINSEAPL